LLQINALHRRISNQYNDDEDELIFENISLIDALNLATSTRKSTRKTLQQTITTNDMKYFCSEYTV